MENKKDLKITSQTVSEPKKIKVSQSLSYSLANVLERRGVKYIFQYENDILYCLVDISGVQFHKLVLRAKMEQMQREEKSSIPYVAECELNDPVVMFEVGSAYIVK